jgi:anti-sigma factor RsiW
VSHLGRRLSALIDGELNEADRDRVLSHLAGCEPCRREARALRMLKQRMNSLGSGLPDGDPDLTSRLMNMASASFAFGDPQSRDTAWLWPAAFPVAVTGPRELRPRRTTVAGAVAFLVVGLGAAAFAAGGGADGQPGPSVTPAVDVFTLQHQIINGETPVVPFAQVVKLGVTPREP